MRITPKKKAIEKQMAHNQLIFHLTKKKFMKVKND